ncbi:SLAC1 family transporter [Subtercola frigoramans]|uniref:Tellurite resistance protein n=1 Tax=Subtercola frigoramans TaxID=120298 RepID=A0ABS2L5E1_9MICO|nr:transporter [Subtercola frigoramans]MBM7472315.1 tellurite resistance protein [Subtercola frigoramans]
MSDGTPAARIPLNTLAIAFGLVGLADVWTATSAALELPAGIGNAFWMIAALSWVWLLVAHTLRGGRTAGTLASQLRHPLQGPIAALAPIVGMLLAADLYHFSPLIGQILVVFFMAATAAFAGWLISTWLGGGLELESLHGGYFLPTVAGGFIGATAAAEVGFTSIAIGAFAVGLFFWIVMFTLITARLMFRPAIPAPLAPTLVIFVAPPAVAGTAWFLIAPTPGPVDYALAATTALMILVQLALIPRYRRLSFTLGFWSFTFPFAAVGGYAIIWLNILRPAGWQIIVVAVVTGITALVVAIAIKSLELLRRRDSGNPILTATRPDTTALLVDSITTDPMKVG